MYELNRPEMIAAAANVMAFRRDEATPERAF
jgi:hypothetical protein